MEKPRGSPRKLKTDYLCIPRLRNNSRTNKAKGPTPMSLLERFREAVFRLIMFSAFSKASDHAGSTDVRRCYRPDNDHRHNEAVADCIEFIKKKALPDDQNRDSSAGSSVGSTTEGVIQVPIIM
ncbi:hypothetical protein PanWU01x14_279880 [Parasponia andersonii]|uniref:Uncharacterized protein n=1 Tax=Parasponia andersonii TaxID=3476 RepID=A0A2P5B1M8_PARAD|nr:hypothetical protein PanWU01x14_279880 [Parasponia andersonii]